MGLTADADKELTEALNNASRAERIAARLQARFPGAAVTVRDDSSRHAGHAGARPEGETHFHVTVLWPEFRAMPRVARHRAVTDALLPEFASGLHALSIDAWHEPQP